MPRGPPIHDLQRRLGYGRVGRYPRFRSNLPLHLDLAVVPSTPSTMLSSSTFSKSSSTRPICHQMRYLNNNPYLPPLRDLCGDVRCRALPSQSETARGRRVQFGRAGREIDGIARQRFKKERDPTVYRRHCGAGNRVSRQSEWNRIWFVPGCPALIAL